MGKHYHSAKFSLESPKKSTNLGSFPNLILGSIGFEIKFSLNIIKAIRKRFVWSLIIDYAEVIWFQLIPIIPFPCQLRYDLSYVQLDDKLTKNWTRWIGTKIYLFFYVLTSCEFLNWSLSWLIKLSPLKGLWSESTVLNWGSSWVYTFFFVIWGANGVTLAIFYFLGIGIPKILENWWFSGSDCGSRLNRECSLWGSISIINLLMFELISVKRGWSLVYILNIKYI